MAIWGLERNVDSLRTEKSLHFRECRPAHRIVPSRKQALRNTSWMSGAWVLMVSSPRCTGELSPAY